jgi:hypothetical protein
VDWFRKSDTSRLNMNPFICFQAIMSVTALFALTITATQVSAQDLELFKTADTVSSGISACYSRNHSIKSIKETANTNGFSKTCYMLQWII